ncbi:MAG: signal peptidase I [Chloroflexi bacterium]|nr:signal peptidase I [Chloroflexota bacterium]
MVYPLAAFLLAKRVVIRGWSMHPTLSPGEYVLFDALAPRLGAPCRGDVVLAVHPAGDGRSIVKRVVAVPGDRVAVSGEECWVNGSPLGEATDEAPPEAGERTLGLDEYFVVGDAPDFSSDARHFGPLRREDIVGRAWLVYWPPRRFRRVRGHGL